MIPDKSLSPDALRTDLNIAYAAIATLATEVTDLRYRIYLLEGNHE